VAVNRDLVPAFNASVSGWVVMGILATTKGGALYTIRIPRTSPMKPVVKIVRGSSWQVFESLVIEKCGVSGTMLLGIDKDSKSGYL
jgi:hypothetical protein